LLTTDVLCGVILLIYMCLQLLCSYTPGSK